MSDKISTLIALTTRFQGSEIEIQYAPKEVPTKKGKSNVEKAQIAKELDGRLPISKIKLGVSKGRLIDYENAVNGQRLLEGLQDDFVSKKANGKTKLGGSIYKSDKDDAVHYIGFEPINSDAETIYVDAKGKQLTDAEIVQYLTSADQKKEAKFESQGVEEGIKFTSPLLSSISWIKIKDNTIHI